MTRSIVRRGLLTTVAVWMIVFAVSIGAVAETNATPADANAVAGALPDAEGTDGPTVELAYDGDATAVNDASDFLYFVPLISETAVECSVSEDNTQTARITDYRRTRRGDEFTVDCRFEMRGKGWHKTRYVPSSLIGWLAKDKPKGDLKNLLEYITFEGEGVGRVEVAGRVDDDGVQVKSVRIHFNADGHSSPVRAGLYSVKRKNGRWRYEDRYDETAVRINTLAFERSDGTPRMTVSVASVVAAGKREGLWGRIKGALANLFIPPVRIAELGRATMLEFGRALYEQSPTFTFPQATNLIETQTATAEANTGPSDRS